MSFTFLQEQGEESSAECFSDIPASALSKLSPIAAESYSNASETESCPDSQSGTMFAPLTESLGGDGLTPSAEGSPARTLVRRENAPESPERKAGYGRNLPASLAKFDPESRSWKTHQTSLFSGLESFLGTWPRWGSMLNGESWGGLRPAWTRTARGSGFLRRPQNKDGRGFYSVTMESTRKRFAGGTRQKMLIHQLLLSAYGGMNRAVANPPFWESLMGWPIGWTALEPLGTDKFHQWLHSHGESFQEPNPQ
jgi:hypothetical protein